MFKYYIVFAPIPSVKAQCINEYKSTNDVITQCFVYICGVDAPVKHVDCDC